MFIKVCLNYIIWWVDRGVEHKKKNILLGTIISFSLKNYYGWFKLMTCSYTVNPLSANPEKWYFADDLFECVWPFYEFGA